MDNNREKEEVEEVLGLTRHAAEVLVGRGLTHAPMLLTLGLTEEGHLFVTHQVVMEPPRSHEDAHAMIRHTARLWLKKPEVVGYILVDEGWFARYDANKPMTVRPEDHSDRIEVLEQHARLRGGFWIYRTYQIHRVVPEEPGVGDTITLMQEKSSAKGDSEPQGVMANLFKHLLPQPAPELTFDDLRRGPQ